MVSIVLGAKANPFCYVGILGLAALGLAGYRLYAGMATKRVREELRLSWARRRRTAIMSKSDVRESKGNVFADIGVRNPDQALAKAELARRIASIIEARGLTQTQAAEILHIDQAKVSALARGYLRGFSAERLFRFLNALGHDVEIRVKTKPAARDRARVHVVGP